MINEESKRQLETRKTLNLKPLNTLSPIDARKQFNETKEYSKQMSSIETEILNVENRKIQILSTAIANEGKSGETYDNYLTTLIESFAKSIKGS